MGAPKVSSAIFTMSMARTTPAQKPRGLRRRTRLFTDREPLTGSTVRGSRVVVVTLTSIPCQAREGGGLKPLPVTLADSHFRCPTKNGRYFVFPGLATAYISAAILS